MKKTLLFLAVVFTLLSCKKDKDGPSRAVKYEITGNYTGKLDILTTTNTAAMASYNGVAVPWTKELTYPDNVMGVGIGGNSTNGSLGVAGQTVTLKVYSGGKLLYTKNATADVNGIIGLPTYAFVFQ